MPLRTEDTRSAVHAPLHWDVAWTPWLVLVSLLAGTLVASVVTWSSEKAAALARLEREVDEKRGRVAANVDAYTALLLGGTGLFQALPDEVTAEQFARWVTELELRERYRGLLGIGWTRRLEPGGEDALERKRRAAGNEGFRVWPATSTGPLRTSIVFLEPRDQPNVLAIGYDMASEPVRAEAMVRAMDTGSPALSGPVTLVQERALAGRTEPGFLIYVPVYNGVDEPVSVAERRQRLRGFVYGAFRAGDMFRHAVRAESGLLEYEVYDGFAPNPLYLLYDSNGRPDRFGEGAIVRAWQIGGRVWTGWFISSSTVPRGATATPWLVGGGLFLSGVVFALLRVQVAARRALHHEKELVEEEVALRERVLAIVSHDLRNPLNAIAMGAALLLRRGRLDATEVPTARRIGDSAARMGRLIDELVDYARLSRGGELALSARSGDVAAVARHAVEELRLVAREKEIRFGATGDTTGCWDLDRLGQLVSNLVGNAVTHGEGPVDVQVRGEADAVSLEVHNGGPPIPVDVLPVIFDAYRQGRPGPEGTGRPPGKGLGLGLYIARQIARAHGGRIEVRSSTGEGTTFEVWLPRSPSAAGTGRQEPCASSAGT